MPNPPPRRPGEPDTVTYNINPSDSRFPAYAISARQSDFPSLERSFARLTRRQYSPLAQFLETAKNQGLRVLLHVNYAIGERAEWNAASNTWSDRIVSTAGERATTIYNSSSSNILQGVTKDPSSSYDVVIILNYDKMSSGDVWDSFSTSVTIGHEFGHAVNPIVFRNSRQFSSDGFRQHLTVTGPALARLRTHSQNSTVAARAMADRKTVGHRSYRVATRRQSFRRPNMISMRLRLLYRRLS